MLLNAEISISLPVIEEVNRLSNGEYSAKYAALTGPTPTHTDVDS
jgi:hypothetical protein